MAGRNYIPPDALKLRQDSHSRRAPIESPPRHHHVDDRIAGHHREIQSLLLDNQRLAATHVALKQELSLAVQDVRHLSSVASNVKAERDAELRELFEKAVKIEAEARLIDDLGTELIQVRGDVQKLSSEKKELHEKLDKVNGDLAKERSKGHQVTMIKSEIESIHKEIQKGRAAVEYEKKVYAINIEQGQAMENSRMSMSREIEKLQTELAEKRARAAVTPGYGAGFVNHDMGYGVNAYPGPYVAHQVQGGVDLQYGSGPVPNGPYDMQMQHHMIEQYGHGVVPQGVYEMQHPNPHG